LKSFGNPGYFIADLLILLASWYWLPIDTKVIKPTAISVTTTAKYHYKLDACFIKYLIKIDPEIPADLIILNTQNPYPHPCAPGHDYNGAKYQHRAIKKKVREVTPL
jgi:hypothetical protein